MSESETISRVGIVGVGAIGSGIAQITSSLGAETIVVAPRPGGVERALERLRRGYAGDVQRGRLGAAEAEAGLARLRVTPHYADLAGVPFVFESVPEVLGDKLAVLAAIEAHTGEATVVASNTSSIRIARLADGARRPGNVIGMHYFWPATRYRLVEIAHAPATSAEAVRRALEMARWQGKTPLLVRDSPGFLTTRILLPYISEAVALVVEGAPIEAVDKAMTGFGWAMGPFKLLDTAGTETLARVYDSLSDHLGDRVQHTRRLWPLIRAGHTGRRGAGRGAVKGFYLYPEGREVDARVYPLLGQTRRADGGPDADEIALRPVLQMINEAAHCLAEGVVASPDDADLGAVLGLGWPHALGGPLAYARRAGPATIVERLQAWTRKFGPRFTPSRALMEMAG